MLNDRSIAELEKILGSENLSTEKEERICYAYDATGRECLPDAVAFPGSAEEISRILTLASKENFPVVPRGAGSGFAGGSVPVKGGVVLALKRMNRILEIDRENMTAVVEPAVVTGHLQFEVEKLGLFYPPDPSSLKFCTLGGNVAVGAGGPRAVKYGVTKDYVLALEAVLPTGEIVRTGTRTVKGVVGYDMTRLLIGSEGTLAVITKIVLKLVPKPRAIATLYVEFPDTVAAGRVVAAIMASGTVPSALELIDRSALDCIREELADPPGEKTGAVLLIELDGSTEPAVASDTAVVEKICVDAGALRIRKESDRKKADKLWAARRAISPALFKLGTKKINEDIAVPRSKVPELMEKMKGLSEKYRLTVACFGHAGDGNIHVNVMLNKGNADEEKRAEEAVKELFGITLAMQGTLSGEHGVGLSKQPYIRMELAEREIELMKGIKKVFDPKNILNPGKIFPEG